jgi:hypothetical protein
MSKREARTILKTDQRQDRRRTRVGREIHRLTVRLGEDPCAAEGDKLDVAVENGRWCCPASRLGTGPVQHYFRTEE